VKRESRGAAAMAVVGTMVVVAVASVVTTALIFAVDLPAGEEGVDAVVVQQAARDSAAVLSD